MTPIKSLWWSSITLVVLTLSLIIPEYVLTSLNMFNLCIIMITSFWIGYSFHLYNLYTYIPFLSINNQYANMTSLALNAMNFMGSKKDNIAITRTNTIIISYDHNGVNRQVSLPYFIKIARSLKGIKFILIKSPLSFLEEENITHQPGIPYFLSANQMEGVRIEVRRINGSCIKKYGSDEIPDINEINAIIRGNN